MLIDWQVKRCEMLSIKRKRSQSHYLRVQNRFRMASGLEQQLRSSWPMVEVEYEYFDEFDVREWLVVEEETCAGQSWHWP